MKRFLVLIGLGATMLLGCGGGSGDGGGSRGGRLTTDDWIVGGEFYADRYIFTVTRDTVVEFNLESNEFDAYLVLIDEFNNVVEDDDSGFGSDARITLSAEAGEEFEIRATSFDEFDVGRYTLRWSEGLRYEGEIVVRGERGKEPLEGGTRKPKTEAK